MQSQKELLELSNRKILTSQNEKSLLEIAFRKSEVYRLFHETSNNTDTEIQNKDWKELRKEIDTTYSNFTAQLNALYPQISELELHICYLIKIHAREGHCKVSWTLDSCNNSIPDSSL